MQRARHWAAAELFNPLSHSLWSSCYNINTVPGQEGSPFTLRVWMGAAFIVLTVDKHIYASDFNTDYFFSRHLRTGKHSPVWRAPKRQIIITRLCCFRWVGLCPGLIIFLVGREGVLPINHVVLTLIRVVRLSCIYIIIIFGVSLSPSSSVVSCKGLSLINRINSSVCECAPCSEKFITAIIKSILSFAYIGVMKMRKGVAFVAMEHVSITARQTIVFIIYMITGQYVIILPFLRYSSSSSNRTN